MSESKLKMLTMADLNSSISRGVKQLEDQISSPVAHRLSLIASSNDKTREEKKSRRKEQLKELAEYKVSMNMARKALRNLSKDATRKDYLNVGLPLVRNPKSFIMRDINFRDYKKEKD